MCCKISNVFIRLGFVQPARACAIPFTVPECCESADALIPPRCYTETDRRSVLSLGRACSSPLLVKDLMSLNCLSVNVKHPPKDQKKTLDFSLVAS